jgi:hypothetical protein
MSKLLSALIAAGFAFGLNAGFAQNVKSDSDKARGQEDVMQQKEQGKDQSAQGQRNRPASDDGRSAQGAAGSDSSSAAQDQNAPQTRSGKQIPEQSAPSVGHPQEGETAGQGKGVKKDNEQSGQSDTTSGASMGNQDNSSGRAR